MLSWIGQRPKESADFQSKVQAAQDAVAKKVAAQPVAERGIFRDSPKSSRTTTTVTAKTDFPDLWAAYRAEFSKAQCGKCAYCEDAHPDGYVGDVEHYRPKAFVTSGEKTLPGYHFLAYNWDNYLFACAWCNRSHKKNQFPIAGNRASTPSELPAELPLLLNPLDEDPAPHLEFLELGDIRGRTDRGEETISMCGLHRKSLNGRRKRLGERLKRHLDDYATGLLLPSTVLRDSALRELYFACRDTEPFTGMARYLLKKRTMLTYADLEALAKKHHW